MIDFDGGRFESTYPYEWDNETGYSRSIFGGENIWTDIMGHQFELKSDPWGNPYYEPVKDEED